MENRNEQHYRFLRRQENLYWGSNYLDKRWYRMLFGGEWRLLKLGKDTPYIGMFCVWTKLPDNDWDGYKEVLDQEFYPETGIDSKTKLFKQFFRQQILRK